MKNNFKIEVGDAFYSTMTNRVLTVEDVDFGLATVTARPKIDVRFLMETYLIRDRLLTGSLRRVNSIIKEGCTWV